VTLSEELAALLAPMFLASTRYELLMVIKELEE
jgi:hypothetical protein